MKKHYLLLLALPFFSFFVHAQELSLDKKTEMLNQSLQVIIPSHLEDSMKAYAIKNNILPRVILKNSLFLKVIYNEKLTVKNRIAYCNDLIKQVETANDFLPRAIIIRQKEQLESTFK